MKRENKRVFLSLLLTSVLVCTTGFRSSADYSQSEAQEVRTVSQTIIVSTLADVIENIPETAEDIAKNAKEEAEERAARKVAKEAAKKAAQKAARKAARKAERQEQIKLLASLIFCEAGNQPYKGQVAVGAVVMNRIKSNKYPNTMRKVIYQKGQFGPAITGWLDRVLEEGNVPKQCYKAARAALNGENPIGDCLYFGCGNYGVKIGDHWFH